MSYLVLDGLAKDFGGHRAVDGLTLTIEKGEFHIAARPRGNFARPSGRQPALMEA
jgi:ABC-type branched-subunit amino acid transport system ATPase component